MDTQKNTFQQTPEQAPESSGTTRRQFLVRGVAAATAASLAGQLLSACADGSSSSEPVSFWNFYGPGGSPVQQSQWFVDAANAWNKANKTQIKLVYVPVTDYISGSKLQTAFATGSGPDIFLLSSGDFLRYYNGGVLFDLTPYVSADAKSDLYPNIMTTRLVDGKIYGLPMEVEPMAMYYSLDAWKSAGLTDADIPTTWDQLLTVAKKLQTSKRFGVSFETGPGYYQNFTWYPFMWQGGSDAVSPDGKSSNFNSQGTIQALKFWQDTIKLGVAPRKFLGNGGGDLVANLAAGYTAIQNCGIWGIAALRENAPNFKYGVFKLPVAPGGTYTTVLGGWAFAVNAKGKNPVEAAKFCASVLGSMSQTSVQKGVDWIAKVKSDVAPRKSVMDTAVQTGAFDSPQMSAFKNDIFPGGRAEPRYPPAVYKAISDAIQACQLGDADPATAAAQAAQTINTYLQSYSGASIL